MQPGFNTTSRQTNAAAGTKQLPTGVGRFIRVALNILKYDVISDVPTGRAEISSRPESPAPIALADFRKLHLDFVGRAPLSALHQIADGDVGGTETNMWM